MHAIGRFTSAAVLLSCVHAASAGSINVYLDGDHQGGNGNKGQMFRPVDEFGELANFVMTAKSSIDADSALNPNAQGDVGTVYIYKEDKGAGVQDIDGKGSKGISGGGGDKDEALFFNFDNPVLASSIQLTLGDFEPGKGLCDKDDAILFIDVLGVMNPIVRILEQGDWLSAVMFTDKKMAVVDFGKLDLGAGAMITSFGIRETNYHIGVTAMANGGGGTVVPLPAPVALGLVGLLGVGAARRRKFMVK